MRVALWAIGDRRVDGVQRRSLVLAGVTVAGWVLERDHEGVGLVEPLQQCGELGERRADIGERGYHEAGGALLGDLVERVREAWAAGGAWVGCLDIVHDPRELPAAV